MSENKNSTPKGATNQENYIKKKSQEQMILEHLKAKKEITPMDALNLYGCFRLGARIADLRGQGYNITTEINQKGKRYAIYRLEAGDE